MEKTAITMTDWEVEPYYTFPDKRWEEAHYIYRSLTTFAIGNRKRINIKAYGWRKPMTPHFSIHGLRDGDSRSITTSLVTAIEKDRDGLIVYTARGSIYRLAFADSSSVAREQLDDAFAKARKKASSDDNTIEFFTEYEASWWRKLIYH